MNERNWKIDVGSTTVSDDIQDLDRRSFLKGVAGIALTPLILGSCSPAPPFILPASRFFIFGEGDRRKLIYTKGKLLDLYSGESVWSAPVNNERYIASQTAVELETPDDRILIKEDDNGVWIGNTRIVEGTKINRPSFEPSPYAARLRALHHEILINIVDGKPLPNLLVYLKPWRRDASMVAMCLSITGNLHLIKPWVLNLENVFDGNAGTEEPDNIGQNLYMLGIMGAQHNHPLVESSLQAARRFLDGRAIAGVTDGSRHTVYQTSWMKMGLKTMGLPDPYEIPFKLDHYGSLAWWFPQQPLPFPFSFNNTTAQYFPYLSWAEAHYWRSRPPPLPEVDSFPQTWEAQASEADYRRMEIAGSDWSQARVSGPHSWHAAEAFLYLVRAGMG